MKYLLVALSVLSLLIGLAALAATLSVLPEAGEQWGLLPVLVLGLPALGLQTILLTAALLLRSRQAGWRYVATVSSAMLLLGLAANGAAQCLIFGHGVANDMEYRDKNPFYSSGLHSAIERGDVTKARSILDSRSVPLSEGDYYGNTPLILAVRERNEAMVQMILERGAGTSDRDHAKEWTALHWAASNGDARIVRLLLAHGADVNKGDRENRTALAVAKAKGHRDIVALLTASGGTTDDLNHAAWDAIYFGKLDTLKQIVDQGLDLNYKFASGASWLHCAAQSGRVETADYLLGKGMDVNVPAHYGTPLHEAATEGRVEMIRFLVSKGADVNARNQKGETPLTEALGFGKEDAAKVLRELGGKE